ncbi:hypothetical protein [Streptomyces sp. URMC 124]|uniref:hypothetical protein n=1 Tax=Streptomyces sp. URMC 124 TaxID=3423405 RepID=UPI003F1A4100
MSGGSYNYLYAHVNGLEAQSDDITAMRDRLTELAQEEVPGASRAASLTQRILDLFDLAEACAKELKDVWLAVEWHDSFDISDGGLKRVFTEWADQQGDSPTVIASKSTA